MLESEIAKLREDLSYTFNQAERAGKLKIESESLNRKKEELEALFLEEKNAYKALSENGQDGLKLMGLTLHFP